MDKSMETLMKDLEPLLAKVGMLDLDYTPESLDRLELVIDATFPEPPELPTTAIPFGCYLGETIVRNIPGSKWKMNGQNLANAVVLVPLAGKDDVYAELYPFVRVDRFFRDRSDGLRVFYDLANLTAVGVLPVDLEALEHGPKGEWSEWKEIRPGGGMNIRAMAIEKDKAEREE